MVNEYALYKGDKLLEIGTIKELSEKLDVKEKTLRFYATPSYYKRAEKSKNNGFRILIKI